MALSKSLLLSLGLSLSAGTAHASLLNYNLALQNNLTGAVHVEGMSFVGGNLTATQLSEFNSGSDTPVGSFDGLEVGGTVSGQVKILGGETATYKTKAANAQIYCVGSVNCSTGGVDLSAKKQALTSEMTTLSTNYKALSTNASVVKSGNQVKLQYTGSNGLAVFNLNSADVFFQNSSIELALGNASKAIINVSGNLAVSNTNLTGNWNYSNTLWNFYDATA
jgi:choice-of-anchor A domain-containing protein